MKKIKFLFVFGTRPEAIKLAMLIKLFQEQNDFIVKICSTDQHKKMLNDVLRVFEISKDYNLDVMRKNQNLTDITLKILKKLPKILNSFKPDYVIVHGDTTTSFSSSLASFYNGVKVIHIEAGLRTSNLNEPFPEELNRRLISKIASIHFAPTKNAKLNLIKEGVDVKDIIVTGNTVIDSLKFVLKKLETNKSLTNSFFKKFNLSEFRDNYFVLTVHRRENQGDKIQELSKILNELEKKYPHLKIIFPIHLNPVLRESFKKNIKSKNLIFIEPLTYLNFIILLKNSKFIMTDSGGIQEESPTLNKKVIVLRNETERTELYKTDNYITGINRNKIFHSIEEILRSKELNKRKEIFGDGFASKRILKYFKK